jgi:hypothetical protein
VKQRHQNVHDELLGRVVVIVEHHEVTPRASRLLSLLDDEIAVLSRSTRGGTRISCSGARVEMGHVFDRVSGKPACRGGMWGGGASRTKQKEAALKCSLELGAASPNY